MTIPLTDTPIAPVDQQLALLVLSDLPGGIDGLLLRVMVGRVTRVSLAENRPTIIALYDVLVFSHRLFHLLSVPVGKCKNGTFQAAC